MPWVLFKENDTRRVIKYFSCFSTKTYVWGTQKNHLKEMVLFEYQKQTCFGYSKDPSHRDGSFRKLKMYIKIDEYKSIHNSVLKRALYLNLCLYTH